MRCWVALAIVALMASPSVGSPAQDDRVVKLCGREFIRAVVVACGGSQWKRYPWKGTSSAEVLDWLDGGVSREPGARPPTPVDKASPEEPLGAMTRVPGGLGLAGGCCTRGCTRRQMTRFC
ncbi:insulin-like 3 [Alligator mississippiensis]|uniref:Insulin-like domain-containing protein n=1 Tax=Alligator mississippiensis TaxID=8496 RepID=A0A151NIW3_ALLMI|nr:insulin-like 3 [Alligator mississippiensis]KYO36743.1 hypothetical protein Y1Q_0017445 [Alligator mississippiensis]